MRQIKTSTQGVVVEEGDFVIVSGQESVRQRVEQRIRSIRGGWRYDLSHGIPYLEQLTDTADLGLVRAIFGAVIVGTPGVDSIVRMDVTRDRRLRQVTISAECRGTDGIVFTVDATAGDVVTEDGSSAIITDDEDTLVTDGGDTLIIG
jgi:hypothetical protein